MNGPRFKEMEAILDKAAEIERSIERTERVLSCLQKENAIIDMEVRWKDECPILAAAGSLQPFSIPDFGPGLKKAVMVTVTTELKARLIRLRTEYREL